MAVTPPIIVCENGDVTVYDDVESAALSMEAVDVLNEEYEVFDGSGLLLTVDADGLDARVRISALSGHGHRDPNRLQSIIRHFMLRVGAERFGSSEEDLGRAGLASLVEILWRSFQARRP
jgi:hypothetical protein